MTTPLSVTEFTAAVQTLLEGRFTSVSIRGEISNCKQQSSGHIYFSLKDAGAQVSAVLFRGSAANLRRLPKDGDQVIANGRISLYAPRGQYQIIVQELQFLGMGELLLKLHQLKETLEKRGWFAPQRKKPLPKVPRRIGIVTSPTGAAIQDILNILTRRFAGLNILVYPVKVQGDGAAQEIAQAIDELNRYQMADLLIIGRGGGSIEDLWAFNEEVVAQAIFNSSIPIISAVGHETDFTIADWVADVRAPTPSAAAELAIAEKANLLAFLTHASSTLRQRLTQQISHSSKRLEALRRHPLLSSPYALLSLPLQKLDDSREELDASMRRTLTQKRELLAAAIRRRELLNPLISIRHRREQLQRIQAHLTTLHPYRPLEKGYALLFSEKEGSLILSSKDVQPAQELSILLGDGKISAIAR